MDSYKSFSRFYDDVMGDRSDVIKVVSNCINEAFPAARSLLELGCGTGSILAGLSDRFTVTGIDISPEMLRQAQQKLPNTHLHLGDITRFDLGEHYDVVICVFDTINHLLDLGLWRSTFANAARHLNDGGLFLFDTLTIGRLDDEIFMPTYSEAFATGSIEITTTRGRDGEVANAITFQQPQPDGLIQVFEEDLHEAAFPLSDIAAGLAADFNIIKAFTSDGNPPTDDSERVYFLCRKKIKGPSVMEDLKAQAYSLRQAEI